MKRILGPRSETFVALLLLVAGVGLTIAGIFEWRTSQRLAAEGRLANAEVIGKGIERRAKNRKTHYLEVQYRTESGQTMLERATVSEARYQQMQAGATVPVRYLADDPTVFAIGTNVKPGSFRLIFGVVLLFIGAISFALKRLSRRGLR